MRLSTSMLSVVVDVIGVGLVAIVVVVVAVGADMGLCIAGAGGAV